MNGTTHITLGRSVPLSAWTGVVGEALLAHRAHEGEGVVVLLQGVLLVHVLGAEVGQPEESHGGQ